MIQWITNVAVKGGSNFKESRDPNLPHQRNICFLFKLYLTFPLGAIQLVSKPKSGFFIYWLTLRRKDCPQSLLLSFKERRWMRWHSREAFLEEFSTRSPSPFFFCNVSFFFTTKYWTVTDSNTKFWHPLQEYNSHGFLWWGLLVTHTVLP